MAIEWLRLWHEMPNDPKWRTIAKISKQPITAVLSVYVHLLVDASRNVTRGHVTVTTEDLASALDLENEQVDAIRAAMEGRVIAGTELIGWAKRQPKKEENYGAEGGPKSPAQSKREQRDRDRLALMSRDVTQSHDESHDVTLEKEKDKDTEKDKTITDTDVSVVASYAGDVQKVVVKQECPHKAIIALYHEILPMCPQVRDWTPARQQQLRARWNEDEARQNMDYWKRFFEYVKTCRFLVGHQPNPQRRPFFADLEWLTKSANFTKIRERKYES